MNSQEIHLIRKTFAEVERPDHVAALVFYRRLFTAAPALRPLFKTGVEAQSRKLMESLSFTVSRLESPATLVPDLEALGARHVGYGVQDSHYEIVGEALIGMLEETLGDQFTAEARRAWVALYGFMADTMKRGAAKAAKAKTRPLPT